MNFITHIDNQRVIEWGLNCTEGALVDWFTRLPQWADKVIIGNDVFYFASRHKAIEENPMVTTKPDTMYRHYKKLASIGLIEIKKIDGKDYIKLEEKVKDWGRKSEYSEKNPNGVGKKSENDSEKNPTNKYISNNKYTNDKEIPKNEFSEDVHETFHLVVPLFPELMRPKNKAAEDSWRDEIRKLIEIDGLQKEVIYMICKWAREDNFWKDNFFSLLKLRKKNKQKIEYWKVFAEKIKNTRQYSAVDNYHKNSSADF